MLDSMSQTEKIVAIVAGVVLTAVAATGLFFMIRGMAMSPASAAPAPTPATAQAAYTYDTQMQSQQMASEDINGDHDALKGAVTPFSRALPAQFVMQQNEQIRAIAADRTMLGRILESQNDGNSVSVTAIGQRGTKELTVNPAHHAKGSFAQDPNLSAVGAKHPDTGVMITAPVGTVGTDGGVRSKGSTPHDPSWASEAVTKASVYSDVVESALLGGVPPPTTFDPRVGIQPVLPSPRGETVTAEKQREAQKYFGDLAGHH